MSEINIDVLLVQSGNLLSPRGLLLQEQNPLSLIFLCLIYGGNDVSL